MFRFYNIISLFVDKYTHKTNINGSLENIICITRTRTKFLGANFNTPNCAYAYNLSYTSTPTEKVQKQF